MVTYVTAYFEIPTKRPSSDYHTWLENLFGLMKGPFVVFGNKVGIQRIHAIREKAGFHAFTHYVEFDLETESALSLFAKKGTKEEEDLLEMEPHKKDGLPMTWWTYAVYTSKLEFLRKAIQMAVFPGDIYVWLDAGYVRYPELKQLLSDSFHDAQGILPITPLSLQPAKLLKQTDLLLSSVYPFQPVAFQHPADDDLRRMLNVAHRITAGVLVGHKAALLELADDFLLEMNYRRNRGIFYGREEPILSFLYLSKWRSRSKRIGCRVDYMTCPEEPHIIRWFFPLAFLVGNVYHKWLDYEDAHLAEYSYQEFLTTPVPV